MTERYVSVIEAKLRSGNLAALNFYKRWRYWIMIGALNGVKEELKYSSNVELVAKRSILRSLRNLYEILYTEHLLVKVTPEQSKLNLYYSQIEECIETMI